MQNFVGKTKCIVGYMKVADDNLRQSVLIRQDRVLALQTKVLASLQVILNFFFFLLFQKRWVGRAMGNEAFYGDGLMPS